MTILVDYLPIFIVLALLEIAVRFYCIMDIHRKDREVVLFSKKVWTIGVAIVHFAWLIYLISGRDE